MSIALLTGGHLKVELDNIVNMDRAKKRIMKYHWSKDPLFFQNLVVPKPIECRMSIEKIHEVIGHFGAMRTLAEVKKRLFWHDKIEVIKKFNNACDKCQLTKQFGNMRFGIEEMKIFPFVICFIVLHWTLLSHCQKQPMAISIVMTFLVRECYGSSKNQEF